MKKRILALLLSIVMLFGCCAMTVSAAAEAVTISGAALEATLLEVDSYMSGPTVDDEKRNIIYGWLATLTSTDEGVDTLLKLADGIAPSGNGVIDYTYIQNYINAYFTISGVASENEKLALKLYLTILKCIPENLRRDKIVKDWHARTAYADYATASAQIKEGTAFLYNKLVGAQYRADGVTEAVFYQLLNNLRGLFVLTTVNADAEFDYIFYEFKNAEFASNLNNILARNFPTINGVSVTSAEDFMAVFCEVLNVYISGADDRKKVAETLATVDSFVYGSKATALTLSTTDATEQTVDSTSNVNVTLGVQKENEEATVIVPKVKWYVNGTLVQTGGTVYTYATPNAEGTYTIKAVSGDVTSNVITITVKKKPSSPSSKPPVAGDSILGDITGGGTGAGTVPGSGTIPMPTPEVYPEIPEPDKVGFVTVNNSTKPIPSVKTTFDDVQNHWAQDHVEVLATTGYVRGHSAQTYAPDMGVTREEMAVILVRVLGIEGQKAAAPVAFSDHDSIQDYAKDAVYRLVELGVYKGHSEGHFAPQLILTREEISALFSRVLGRAGLVDDKEFHDHHEIADWFEADVENLINFGVVKGYPDNTFRPQDDVTRAEAAVMLYNTLHRLGILK